MTAYVLGATGFVGRETVRQLCVRGTKTIAHVRPDSKKLEEWRGKLAELGAEVDTTVWEPVAMAAKIRALAPQQIYILIGTTRSKAKADSLEGNIYEAVDLGLTKIAAEAARASEIKPRLVYLSSVGADPTARSAYLNARGRAEEVVKTAGVPWVIARPSIITGEREDGRFGERTAAVVGDGLLAFAGVLGGKKLRARYRSTTPDVLASALIRLGEAPEHDRVFDGIDLR
ncbi:MAG: NAD-dependent epimerase/dehydratase [Myxococcales bacterium]|nr:NAD-dependent epimerase/dehydratase [Myxococcales bacterium]